MDGTVEGGNAATFFRSWILLLMPHLFIDEVVSQRQGWRSGIIGNRLGIVILWCKTGKQSSVIIWLWSDFKIFPINSLLFAILVARKKQHTKTQKRSSISCRYFRATNRYNCTVKDPWISGSLATITLSHSHTCRMKPVIILCVYNFWFSDIRY